MYKVCTRVWCDKILHIHNLHIPGVHHPHYISLGSLPTIYIPSEFIIHNLHIPGLGFIIHNLHIPGLGFIIHNLHIPGLGFIIHNLHIPGLGFITLCMYIQSHVTRVYELHFTGQQLTTNSRHENLLSVCLFQCTWLMSENVTNLIH